MCMCKWNCGHVRFSARACSRRYTYRHSLHVKCRRLSNLPKQKHNCVNSQKKNQYILYSGQKTLMMLRNCPWVFHKYMRDPSKKVNLLYTLGFLSKENLFLFVLSPFICICDTFLKKIEIQKVGIFWIV